MRSKENEDLESEMAKVNAEIPTTQLEFNHL